MERDGSKVLMQDMTEGKPLQLILGFAIPMLLGMLFQQFYSMVDTIIVGKFLGVDALASVGSTSAVNFMVIGFVQGVCSGFAIPVAQRFGAQDYSDMRRFAANSAWVSAVFAVIMTAVICLLTWNILEWMQTPEISSRVRMIIYFTFSWGSRLPSFTTCFPALSGHWEIPERQYTF